MYKQKYILNNMILYGILTCLLLTNTACSKKVEVVTKAQKVKTVQPAYSNLESKIDYLGEIKPAEEIYIATKVPGRVSEVNIDVGKEVNPGDILFSLDQKEVLTQLKASEIASKNAEESLSNIGESTIPQQYTQLETAVKQLKIQVSDTKKNFATVEEKYQRAEIPKDVYDDSKYKLDLLLEQLATAEKNFKLFKDSTSPKMISMAKKQVEQARNNSEQIRVQIENAVVKSPILGIVSSCSVKLGEMVDSSVPSVTIISKDLNVKIGVPESVVMKLKIGESADLSVSSAAEKPFNGVIENISPTIDQSSKLYEVKIKVPNNNNSIKPGMNALVKLNVQKLENVLVVPKNSVLIEDGFSYVYVVKDKVAQKKVISTGISDEKFSQVLSGLGKDEKVISEGQSFIADGESVSEE